MDGTLPLFTFKMSRKEDVMKKKIKMSKVLNRLCKMNMKIPLFGLISLALAFGVFIIISTLPAHAFDRWGGEDSIREVLIKGADLHLSRQGTYENSCGAKYGPPDVPSIENTWEWKIGSGWTCWNVGGISAEGLLAAYERTHNWDYLKGAIAQGNTLIAKYNTIVIDDPKGAEWEDRPFSQDIEFLVRLSRASHNHSYARVAHDWYDIIINNKTAEENADRYIDNRMSLAGWDLASQIRAACALGKWHYARGMAKRLLERRADWEKVMYSGYDWTMLSYASLLWAFAELRFGGREIAAAEREFRHFVLKAQVQEGPQKGSWDEGSYQTTAYAILGLDAVTGMQHDVAKALGKAFAFLRDTQTEEGGWSYLEGGEYVEYGEENSEVLMALSELRWREIGGRYPGHF
jgi:hypothetical protein